MCMAVCLYECVLTCWKQLHRLLKETKLAITKPIFHFDSLDKLKSFCVLFKFFCACNLTKLQQLNIMSSNTLSSIIDIN